MALHELSARRDQEKKSDEVREHAGRYQQRRCDKDQHAIDDWLGRRPARAEFPPQAPERADPLPPCERRTHHPGPEDESEGGERTDTLTDLDEEDQLDGRYNDNEK